MAGRYVRIQSDARKCADYIGHDVSGLVVAYSFPYLFQEAMQMSCRPFNANSSQCAAVLKSLFKQMHYVCLTEYRITLIKASRSIVRNSNRLVCNIEPGRGTSYYREHLPKAHSKGAAIICVPAGIRHPSIVAYVKRRYDDMLSRVTNVNLMASGYQTREQVSQELRQVLQIEHLPERLTDEDCDRLAGFIASS